VILGAFLCALGLVFSLPIPLDIKAAVGVGLVVLFSLTTRRYLRGC
jgi:hypothetical protein